MAESKLITTQTILNVISTSITITTLYVSQDIGNVISAFISEQIGGETINSIFFKEGEGGVTSSTGATISFILNSNGELIVIGTDASSFGIDSNGELTYTN